MRLPETRRAIINMIRLCALSAVLLLLSGSFAISTASTLRFTKISAGFAYHTLAVDSDGFVWASGNNQYGQLGDGTTTIRPVPVQVNGLSGVNAVSAGSNFSLALRNDGTVWAWGYGNWGQLGDGTQTTRTTPVMVVGLSDAVAVSAGQHHSLALKSDGTVWAWGYNATGQLGDGTATAKFTPVRVAALTGVIAIDAGYRHSMALRNDGTVWAWGYNSSGEIGNGTTTNKFAPVQVTGLTGATAISAGAFSSLAIRNDGTVWAWGDNAFRQLSDGTTVDKPSPVQIAALAGVTAVSAGFYQSLAILGDGTAWKWNSSGMAQVNGLTDVTLVSDGYGFSVALRSDGSFWAWGDIAYGQLGNGTMFNEWSPVQIAGQTGYSKVSAGARHSLALSSDGTVWSWGNNLYGQLGDGTTVEKLSPVMVSGLANVTAVSAGNDYSLALRSDGTVWAWGYNATGQLGDGTAVNRYSPVQVSGMTGATAISAGYIHSLALRDDGTAWAWGSNSYGQLGDGNEWTSYSPVQVAGLTGATAVSAGAYYSLALRNDGTVWGWGCNNSGQLGDGTTTNRPNAVQTADTTSIIALSTAISHSLALRNDGTVWAWGTNGNGLLGDGTTTSRLRPVQVAGLSGATAVSAGYGHSLATVNDGTAWAWGGNTNGELGNGTSQGSLTPVQVDFVTGATTVSAGGYHSMALKDTNVLVWGSNGYGQLGTGNDAEWLTPFQSFIIDGNLAPLLDSIGLQIISENSNLSFTVSASDPDGDTLTYSATGLPAGATLDASTGAFNWTPDYLQSGTYSVIFSVTDGVLSDSETVDITVSGVNRPPVLSAVENKEVDENTALSFAVLASDPDGDILSYSATGLPAGATLDASTGAFNWTPDYLQSGTYSVTFSATDGVLTDTGTTTIVVNNNIHALLLSPIGDQNLSEEENLFFLLSTDDFIPGSHLTYSAAGLPAGATFEPSMGEFVWSPDFTQAGSYEVTFTVTDDQTPANSDSETITITVTNINVPPYFVTIGNKSVNENATLSFILRADSIDGDFLTYDSIPLPDGADLDPVTGTFLWKPDYWQSGSYSVTFVVSDGALIDTETISIVVNNVNQPPVLAPIGSKSVVENTALSFTISGPDPDGDPVVYSATGLPTGASFDAATKIFNWTPGSSQIGTHSITFTVTDGALTDSETISIAVISADSPVLAAIGSKTVKENEPLSFTLCATDPNGDTLTYSAASLPAGATLEVSSGVFNWTPDYTQKGYYSVVFTVSDGALSDSETIVINVQNMNRAPSFWAIGPKTVNKNKLLDFSLRASDPDGDFLAYSASGLPSGAVFDELSGYFSWKPDLSQAGTHPVTFTVSDGSLSTSETVEITVTGYNNPPVLSAVGNKTIYPGESLTFALSASDADGDGLVFDAVGLPPGATFDASTKIFNWTPTAEEASAYDVTFTVTDNGTPPLKDTETVKVIKKLLLPVSKISAGPRHTLALASDGTVWVSGSNEYGRLGDGTTTDRWSPVQIAGLTGITDISAGGFHSVALHADGTVWAWGCNIYGRVGDGTTTDRWSPVKVRALTGVTAISAGGYHSLALRNDGTVWAWGGNTFGQLGDGTLNNRSVPVPVPGLTGVTAVFAGGDHSLALKGDGTLWAWGNNSSGQLGFGIGNRSTPAQLTNLTGVTTVSAGNSYTLAVKGDGTVWAWGSNSSGSLGDGTNTIRYNPVQVVGLTGVAAVSAKYSHSAALKNDGTVWTWGSNSIGQLGDGTTTDRWVPVQVAGLTGVTAVSLGELYSLAVKEDGTVFGWGNNYYGQLGDDTVSYVLGQTQVKGIGEVSSVAAGLEHSLALDSEGTVWTWGRNARGQLGDGTTADSWDPVQVTGLTGITAIASRYSHSLALRGDGTVWAWGWNVNGQLGDGTTTDRPEPVQVAGLTGIKAVATGDLHSIALRDDGTLWAWGYNSMGILGDGTVTNRLIPVQVVDLTGVIAISASTRSSLALRGDGTVWAWGWNILGDGTRSNRSRPVQVVGLTSVVAISSGTSHSLALRADGTVWAWGWNGDGQLGDGTKTERLVPVQVNGLSYAIPATSGAHSLAAGLDGKLWAWGDNSYGQLGDGTVIDRLNSISVPGLADVKAAVAGGTHSLALRDDGTVWTWGNNLYGQAGTGVATSTAVPSLSFMIDVSHRPFLGPIGSWTTDENTELGFTLRATDIDGDVLAYSAVGLPSGAVFDTLTGAFSWTPDYTQAGMHSVTFTVTDGALTDSETVEITVIDVNRAPVLDAVGDNTAPENTHISFTLSASDPDGDGLTYSATGLPAGATLDATTGAFGWTPDYTQSGSYSVTFTVTDGALAGSETVDITVSNVDLAPVLETVGGKNVSENSSLYFSLSATDPDNDELTYSAVGLPSGASLDASTGAFSWTPDYTQAGTHSVTFTVTDGALTDSESISIDVANVNRAPVMAVTGNKAVNESSALSFDISATDHDGDNLTYSAIGLPSGASLDASTGAFSWTPDYTQADRYRVTFTVTDGTLTDSEAIDILVTNTNRAPVMAVTGSKAVDESSALAFGISATDPDGDNLTYFSAVGLPAGASLDASTGTFNWTPDYTQAGIHSITFTVTDGALTDSETVEITVNDVNRAPVMAAIGDKTIAEKAGISFTLSATDPDGDSLTYSATGLPAGASLDASTGTFNWTPDYTQAGTHSITFTVTDGALTDSETISIVVADVNRAPVMAVTGNKAVNESSALSFGISATDPDGDSLTYSATGLPAGASLDASTGAFNWTPDYTQAGTHNITFTVTDGALTDSETISIVVADVNRAPVLTEVGSKTIAENSRLSFSLNATDPDGHLLSFKVEGLPAAAVLNKNTGDFSWIPTFLQAGTYEAVFTATDNGTPARSTSETVTITVTNVNHTPFAAAENIETVMGKPAGVVLTVTDSDTDDKFTAIVKVLPANGMVLQKANGSYIYIPATGFYGEDSFTLTVSDGKGGVADAEVLVTVLNSGAYEDNGISGSTTYGDASFAGSVCMADVTGDGISDMVVADIAGNQVLIYEGSPAGAFTYLAGYSANGSPEAILATDLDGDGDIDIVSILAPANQISVLLNAGDGSFGSAGLYSFTGKPTEVAAADFDHDGMMDLVVSTTSPDAVSVLAGKGAGAFAAGTASTLGYPPSCLIAVDVNVDGEPDLITVDSLTGNVLTLVNSSGTFTHWDTIYEGSSSTTLVQVADVMKGGNKELIVMDNGTGMLTVYRQNLDGSFAQVYTATIGLADVSEILSSDINGDQNPDIIVIKPDEAVVILGDGLGGVDYIDNLSYPDGSADAYFGDVNGDGNSDLITIDQTTGNITVSGVSTEIVTDPATRPGKGSGGGGAGCFIQSLFTR